MNRPSLVQVVNAFRRSETRSFYSPGQIREASRSVLSPYTLGKAPPSYVLLRGPQDVGKRVTALSVVQALCCEQEEENLWGMLVPPHESCGQCAACESLRRGQCPDLIEVEPSTCSPEVLHELAGQNPTATADKFHSRFILIERIERLSVPAFHTLCELLWYPEQTARSTLFLLTVTADSELPWHPGILANYYQEREPRPQSYTCKSDFLLDVWPHSVYPTQPNALYSPTELSDAEGLLEQAVPAGWEEKPEDCVEPLKALVQGYPFFLDAHEIMAWVARRLGRLEDAAYHLTQYIALSQAPSQLAQLGRLMLTLDRLDEAIVALEYSLFLHHSPTLMAVKQVRPASAEVIQKARLDLAAANTASGSTELGRE
jgi:hypothetical protein